VLGQTERKLVAELSTQYTGISKTAVGVPRVGNMTLRATGSIFGLLVATYVMSTVLHVFKLAIRRQIVIPAGGSMIDPFSKILINPVIFFVTEAKGLAIPTLLAIALGERFGKPFLYYPVAEAVICAALQYWNLMGFPTMLGYYEPFKGLTIFEFACAGSVAGFAYWTVAARPSPQPSRR
jgi:hypothetical protein